MLVDLVVGFGLLRNHGSLEARILGLSERVQLRARLLELCDLVDDGRDLLVLEVHVVRHRGVVLLALRLLLLRTREQDLGLRVQRADLRLDVLLELFLTRPLLLEGELMALVDALLDELDDAILLNLEERNC